MSARQLWEGADGAPWARKLGGRTKLCLILFQSVYALSVDNPRSLLYGLLFCLCLHVFAKTSIYRWRVLAILILLGLWGSMASQALFYMQPDRTPLFTLISPDAPFLGALTGGVVVYREGFLYGAVQGLRSASMMTMGLFVCWTSDPRNLLKALCSWKIPVEISFMAVTALRFLPVLAGEAAEVMTALKLRSGTALGRYTVLFNLTGIISPLLARSLRRAQVLSLSVVSRGFLEERVMHKEPWAHSEKSFCFILIMAGMFLLFAKGSYLWSEQGFYYENLRPVYDFAKLHL